MEQPHPQVRAGCSKGICAETNIFCFGNDGLPIPKAQSENLIWRAPTAQDQSFRFGMVTPEVHRSTQEEIRLDNQHAHKQQKLSDFQSCSRLKHRPSPSWSGKGAATSVSSIIDSSILETELVAICGYELAIPDEAGILNPRATIIGGVDPLNRSGLGKDILAAG
jgi:hypothetical protein